MYKGHTVAVVVPAYDEEGFVGEVLETVPDFVDRIYAIDDRSTDDTWREIRTTAERLNRDRPDEPSNRAAATAGDATALGGDATPADATAPGGDDATADADATTAADGGRAFSRQVVPIRHETNRGVGGALKTGYRRAYEDGIDVTAVMGGDGQMDPDLLDQLVDPIVNGEADYAKGNRLLHATYREEMPKFRLFGNYVLSLLTKVSSGYWTIGDPQNGYTAISHRALAELDIDSLYDRYGFANELLARLNRHGMRVADVAMPAIYGDEESSIEYHTFVPTVSKLLLATFLWRLKGKYLALDGTGATRERRSVVALYALGLLGVLSTFLTRFSPTSLEFGATPAGGNLPLLFTFASVLAFAAATYVRRRRNADLELQVTAHLEGET